VKDCVFAGAPDQLSCGLVPPLAPAQVYIVGIVPPLVNADDCRVKPLVAEPVKRMAVTYGALEIAGEADAAADGDGPVDAAGDAAGLTAADGDGEGEAAGFAAGEAAGATVGAAAGAAVGGDGAAGLQATRPSTAAVSNAHRHEDKTKAVTRAFYAATCWLRSASLSRELSSLALVPFTAMPVRLRGANGNQEIYPGLLTQVCFSAREVIASGRRSLYGSARTPPRGK
jgi:hypothetical protein